MTIQNIIGTNLKLVYRLLQLQYRRGKKEIQLQQNAFWPWQLKIYFKGRKEVISLFFFFFFFLTDFSTKARKLKNWHWPHN